MVIIVQLASYRKGQRFNSCFYIIIKKGNNCKEERDNTLKNETSELHAFKHWSLVKHPIEQTKQKEPIHDMITIIQRGASRTTCPAT